MKPKLQTVWWHKQCLEMQYEYLMRLINERDHMNKKIRHLDELHRQFRQQIAQAEAEGLREFDPDAYPLKEEAN